MKTGYRLTLALAATLAGGCAATTDNSRSGDVASFLLQAGPRNAGQTGRVSMVPMADDRTSVVLNVSGVPPFVSRPVQLYTFIYKGSCAAHAEPPAFALNDIVQAGLFSNSSVVGPFTLSKNVALPMGTLRSGGYAIVVRTSPADQNVDIFCGDMK
jgi:hypothetical protein